MLKGRRYRTILSILLTAAMIFSGMQTVAFANPESDGDAVQINTAEELIEFAGKVNEGNDYDGKIVQLTNDIDLSTSGDWTPIGAQSEPFKGTFDGGGHTVSGYKLSNGNTDNGFFGCIDGGTVEDIEISGVKISRQVNSSGKDWTLGMLAGTVKNATLSNITIKDVTIDVTVTAAKHALIGGVAGAVDCSTSTLTSATEISGCVVKDLSVTYDGVAGEHISIGGVAGGVGKISSNYKGATVNISGCRNDGFKVQRNAGNSSNYEMIGGISGYTNAGGTISNCHSAGLSYDIKADVPVPPKASGFDKPQVFGIYGGGITGCVDGGMKITGCTSEGEMTADVEGGYETTTKAAGKTVQGGFFGGITGFIGSMPEIESSGWKTISYVGKGATIGSCFAKIVFTAADNEAMRHASALRAVEKNADITIKNYFTLCRFAGGEYEEEGLDYDNGHPLLGVPVAQSAGNVTQSDKNIFLLLPKTMEVGKEDAPAGYIGFDNNRILTDELDSPKLFTQFIGSSGSVTYTSTNATTSDDGSRLTFNAEGTQYVNAKIVNDSDETIEFTFPVEVKGATEFTIEAEAGENGSIAPEGDVKVQKSSSQEFIITPDTGYRIKDVTVDGSSVGTEDSYTFENVDKNHTIKADFEPEEYLLEYKGLEGASVQPANPERYTVETESFTLNNPERTGYTFAGWTGTGLNQPTMTVTVEKGSTGNREYTATWTKNGSSGGSGSGSGSSHVTTDRIGGANRFETAVKVAERLKDKLGISRFNTIIVASGGDFADALSAAPLASEKDAPILVVNGYNEDYVKAYIDENLSPDGRVYIIGETAAVPAEFEKSLSSHKVTRLGGADRYETNLEVLKALNLSGESEIMIASGLDYADALSASATGNPVLLVKDCVFDYQKSYLMTLGGDDEYFVIGGTAAVNERTMDQIEELAGDRVSRVWGDDRFKTAEAVANKFFKNARTMYIASGCDFPDSLTGGVIAHENGAPMLLVSERNYSEAARFADTHSVRKVTAIGGTAAVSDKILYAVAR